VVLDNGSGWCKAGFAGDGAPRVDVPAVVGWPRVACGQPGAGLRAVGAEAERRASGSNWRLRYPIDHGVVFHWEDLETVWHHALARLEALPGQHPVLLTEAPLNPKANRELMVVELFEQFDVPAVHVAVSGALSLYATGSRSGTVLESGDGTSHVVPIFDDYVVPHAVQRLDMGGRDLTAHLARLLREERGYRLAPATERRAASEVKERLCYVAESFQAELEASAEDPAQERSYELPDGSAVIAAGSERFRCPEALFQPGLLGRESRGVHEMAFQAITACDVDVQRALSSNVVLSGGSALFQGMRERMLRELAALLPPTAPLRVSLPPEPRHAAFVGGSILASLGDFRRTWISKQDYEEFGTSVINAKSMCLTEARICKGS